MEIFVQPDTLTLGLELDLEERPVPALYVRWIAWNSGFRGSGLRVGDRIVALDGERLDLPRLRELEEQVQGPERDGLIQEHLACTKRVEEYFKLRGPYFASLLEAMDGLLARSSGAESRWKGAIDAMEQNRSAILGKLLDGFPRPSKMFQHIQGQLAEEQRQFIDAIRGLDAPRRFGALPSMLAVLEDFGQLLRANYRDMLIAMRSVHDRQQASVDQIASRLDGASRQYAQREASVRAELSGAASKLRELVGKASTDLSAVRGGAAEAWSRLDASLKAHVSSTVGECRALADEWSAHLSTLRASQASELRVLSVFRTHRQQAESYLGTPPPERAAGLIKDCHDGIGGQAGKLKSRGAREDYNELGGELLAKADAVKNKVGSAYDTFKSDHGGRFFGGLNDRTREDLTCKKTWAEWWRRLSERRKAAAYGEAGDRAKNLIGTDLLDAYDAILRAVQAQKQGQPYPERDALVEELRKHRSDLGSWKSSCESELASALMAVSALLASSELAALYQRSEVESSLS